MLFTSYPENYDRCKKSNDTREQLTRVRVELDKVRQLDKICPNLELDQTKRFTDLDLVAGQRIADGGTGSGGGRREAPAGGPRQGPGRSIRRRQER